MRQVANSRQRAKAVETSAVEVSDVEAAAESTHGHTYDHMKYDHMKDPSPLMRRKLADNSSRGGSENTRSAGADDEGLAV